MASKIIDVHPHIISNDDKKYPITPIGGKRSKWSAERPITFEQMVAAMNEAGVDKAAIVHSSTFHQGAMAMTAGLAALAAYDETNAAENARKMGARIKDGLEAMKPRFEMLKEVRQRGLMIGIEFGAPKSLTLKTAWTITHKLDQSLFPQAAIIPLLDKHHIITQVAGHNIDVIKLLPPFVISDDDVRWFLPAFEDVLVQMHKFPGPAWDVLTDIGKMALTTRSR